MGGFSLIHWLILGLIILLLFGGNRFSSTMGDVAKGLKGFKQGLADDQPAAPHAPELTREGGFPLTSEGRVPAADRTKAPPSPGYDSQD